MIVIELPSETCETMALPLFIAPFPSQSARLSNVESHARRTIMKRIVATLLALSIIFAIGTLAYAQNREQANKRKLAEMKKQIVELKERGKLDEARELAERAEALYRESFEQKRGNQPGHRDENDRELADAKRKIVELLAQGRLEEAAGIQRRMREHFGFSEPQGADWLNEVTARIHELHEQGKHDEAENLERQLREKLEFKKDEERRRHEEDQQRTRRGDRRPPEQREPSHESRIQHLREAAEHLMAAGFRREAEQIMRNAEQLQRENHERERDREHQERERPEVLMRELHEVHEKLQHAYERIERLEDIVNRIVADDNSDGVFEEEEEEEEEEN